MAKGPARPLVSVCVPTYNYARYVGEAISSCLDQSYRQIEVIVVDDASGDQTEAVVGAFRDGRLRFLRNPKRLGLVRNWNRAASLARGEVIKFVFADDALMPGALEKMVEGLATERVDLVFSAARVVDGGGKEIGLHRPCDGTRRVAGADAVRRCLREGNYIGGPSSVALRRAAFVRAGPFDEGLPFAGDLEMWVRILLRGDALFLGEPLVSIRQHEGSETRRLERAGETRREMLRFFERCLRNGRLRRAVGPEDVAGLLGRYEDLAAGEAARAAGRGAYREACAVAWRGLRNARLVPYARKLLGRMFPRTPAAQGPCGGAGEA